MHAFYNLRNSFIKVVKGLLKVLPLLVPPQLGGAFPTGASVADVASRREEWLCCRPQCDSSPVMSSNNGFIAKRTFLGS